MDKILFVVDTEGVHQDVDTETEGMFALRFIAGDDGKGPVSEAIAFPCASVIVHRIEDGGAVVEGNAFDVRFAKDTSTKASDQVKRPIDGVFKQELFHGCLGKDAFGETAGGFIKVAVFVIFAAVDPQQSAVGEISTQAEDILCGEWRKALCTGQDQHRESKKPWVLGCQVRDIESDLDRCAFGEAQQKRRDSARSIVRQIGDLESCDMNGGVFAHRMGGGTKRAEKGTRAQPRYRESKE